MLYAVPVDEYGTRVGYAYRQPTKESEEHLKTINKK